MRARRLTWTAVAAVVVLGSSACGQPADPVASDRPPERASAPASPLAFTSPAIGGGTVDGATFQGRPTLLWFWAPW